MPMFHKPILAGTGASRSFKGKEAYSRSCLLALFLSRHIYTIYLCIRARLHSFLVLDCCLRRG